MILLHNVPLYSSHIIVHGMVDGGANWAFIMYFVIDKLIMVNFLQNETICSCMQNFTVVYPLKG